MKEDEFWQAVYIAVARTGASYDWSLEGANKALGAYQKKFMVAECKPKDKGERPTT